ncbi:LUC7-like protein [Cordyceps militaris]|uniref:LUC7-like protein n=1 Tax=Cordyceps militaris TaxID=73501 RepID=A0A2H4S9U4_CORMI|nr:LUC7-like protein [Cordyceps militaris]
MANEEYLTDEYVAGLLSQEASDCSIKYSAMGVDAFLGKDSNSKKPSNIPKPNTRFLRNIIKGTDTHNKALLAKEAAESKARLKGLERAEETKRKKSNPSTKDIRERHMGAIQAILGGGKRRERDRENDDEKKSNSQGRDKAKRITRDHRSEDVSGVTAPSIIAAAEMTGVVQDTGTTPPMMDINLADIKALEMIDLGLLEADIDYKRQGVEIQNGDGTGIARRLEIN